MSLVQLTLTHLHQMSLVQLTLTHLHCSATKDGKECIILWYQVAKCSTQGTVSVLYFALLMQWTQMSCAYKVLVRKPQEKRPLGRARHS